MKTYLFYDLETTGLSCSFDQPLQFAGIRTDTSLRELERYKIQIRLSNDIIPSPSAIITHRLSVETMQQGISGLEAIQQIHRLLNTPDTISIGYNSLGFDDEFLRFYFYRHLLPPYTHQFANGCSRADIYPMTLMYFLFQKDIIKWPVNDKGKPTFKLAKLNEANGWSKGPAHDALADVEATLGLARCMRKNHAMWDYLIKGFNKKTDESRLASLPTLVKTEHHEYKYGLLVQSNVGIKRYFITPVILLGFHHYYKNQLLCLQIDTARLKKTTPETIAKNTFVFRKKLGENGFILPPKPRYLEALQENLARCLKKNINWLTKQEALLDEISMHYRHYTYPDKLGVDPEAALYVNGFATETEQALCRQFHLSSPADKAGLLDTMADSNLQRRAIRLMGRYYPTDLPAHHQKEFARYLDHTHPLIPHAQTLLDFQGKPKLTPDEAIKEISTLLAAEPLVLDEEQRNVLIGLKKYLSKQFFLPV